MRGLLLTLLVANLLVLAWRHWVIETPSGEALRPTESRWLEVPAATPQPAPVVAETASEPVREPARDTPAPAPAMADRQPPDPPDSSLEPQPPQCVRIGPFFDPALPAQLAETLRARGLAPTQSVEEGEVWMGYWLLASFETRDQAREAVRQLQGAGVPDAYVIPGTETFTVSLGLFSQRAGAERLAERAAALRIATELRDRYREGTVQYLLLALPADEALPELPAGPGARDARVLRVNCP